jgi:hypothetical protein
VCERGVGGEKNYEKGACVLVSLSHQNKKKRGLKKGKHAHNIYIKKVALAWYH